MQQELPFQLHAAILWICASRYTCSTYALHYVLLMDAPLDICLQRVQNRGGLDRIEKELTEDPPMLINKGSVIREGVSSELDELRKIQKSGKDFLQLSG